jgi:predicted GNAT family N-acyltransferase
MALRIIDHNTEAYKKMVALRFDILRKPLGLTFSTAELEKEKNDILIVYDDEELIEGCCILTKVNEEMVQLRQMAVITGLQGKGIGRAIMLFAENIARDTGYKILMMHARDTAVGFYEKLGYEVQGNMFEEVSIPHFEMRKKL